MKGTAVVALALVGSAYGMRLEDAKNRPVSKVITLLKDMRKQLETDQEEDEAIYKKMGCWCTTNDKEKTQAISDAEAHIADLQAAIEGGTAKSAQLTTEIANLEKEVAENQAALGKATSLRKKALAEFNEEEKDLLSSIAALKSAITVLEKHQSFLQTEQQSTEADDTNMIKIAVMLQHQMHKYSDKLDFTPGQLEALKAFIQQPTFKQAYANQSGEIFGILSNMQDTFEADLSTAQSEETAAASAYTELKAAKEAEIAAGQDQVDTKTDELAATDEKLANDKQDLEDTRASLSADEQFLMMLKEKCAQTDQEWEARQKTRTEEIAAVGEALKVLSDDDAHDTFTTTFNKSFLQVRAERAESSARREKAAAVLSAVLKKHPSAQLSAVATSVRLDAFTKVKKAIDDMVVALKREKEDEIKHRDFCIGGLNDNEKATTKMTRDHEDMVAKMDELEAEIETLASEIATLNEEIAETKKQLKIASEDREKQNAEFQTTVADQRSTMKLLNQALAVLKGFYQKKGVAFMQQEPVGPPPPAGFKSYENNAGGNSVIAMITQIVTDAKAMEAEAIHDEEDAQKTYEAFVVDSNATVDSKSKEVVNKTEAKATAEGDHSAKSQEKKAAEIELEQLGNAKADLHKSCDFTMKNFDVRQEARDQEIEALGQAKAILSGSDFGSF